MFKHQARTNEEAEYHQSAFMYMSTVFAHVLYQSVGSLCNNANQ